MKYQNWLTGAKVVIINQFLTDTGQEMVEYIREVKRRNEFGHVIESHEKPLYVFNKIYQEVTV